MPEREIEIPYQPYIVMDEQGREAEGIYYVLRLDMEATNPMAQLAAREAMLRYAVLHPDREHAKLCVRMVCQIKDMSEEATEELWNRVQEAYNGRKVSTPRPQRRRMKM